MPRSLRTICATFAFVGLTGLFAPAHAGNDASGITMLATIPFSELPGENVEANDIYGYTSPSGREYALCGMRKGLAFLEITTPTAPVVVGYTTNTESLWGDMCTHGTYAYKVNEAANGIQVIDMTNIDSGSVTLVTEIFDGPQNSSHNIQANNESGYIYTLGSDNFGGGIMAFNVSDPANPVFEGGWDGNYAHDALFRSYPSGTYAGREFSFVAGGGGGVHIVDVTDKTNMFSMSASTYPGISYTHQLWLDDDERYLYVNDELDELVGNVPTTTTYVFDVTDLSNPVYLHSFTNGITATDHNMSGRGNLLFQANYESGLRVYDIADVNNVSEVGYYDTYPAGNEISFNGAWGVFTEFASGVVIVSDRASGFWIFDPFDVTSVDPSPNPVRLLLDASPNPFSESTALSFSLEESAVVRLDIVDSSGRQVDQVFGGTLDAGSHRMPWHPKSAQNGVYFAILKAGTETRTGRIVLSR